MCSAHQQYRRVTSITYVLSQLCLHAGDGEDEGDGEGHSSEDETGGGENDAERNEAHRQAARELASNNQNGEQQQEQEQEEREYMTLGEIHLLAHCHYHSLVNTIQLFTLL